MNYDADMLQQQALLQVAARMIAAARTAPKARGADRIQMVFLTGEDRDLLAAEVERLGQEHQQSFFMRDANNIRKADGIVLIGVDARPRGNTFCGLCGFVDCAACTEQKGRCALAITDLGIAVGSAVSVAADARVDNRVFFTAGLAAVGLSCLGENVHIAYGIPLSITGKNIFFDR